MLQPVLHSPLMGKGISAVELRPPSNHVMGHYLGRGKSGKECQGIVWKTQAGNPDDCLKDIMADPSCGKIFLTWSKKKGCACYPPAQTTCETKRKGGRKSFDIQYDSSLVPTTVSYSLSETALYSGQRCQDIQWLFGAETAKECLEKILTEEKAGDCGRSFLTWNKYNGGCACYPAGQTTCTPKRESGRMTYEILGGSPSPPPTEPPAEPPTEPPTVPPTAKPTAKPTEKPTEAPTEAPEEEPNSPPTPPSGEQCTPDKADWSTFYSKAAALKDHSPNGIDWLNADDWEEWDGQVIDPTQYSKNDFYKMICPTPDKVRGIKTLFYKHNPFADLKHPTKAEVDHWHALALNHVRAMVGYTDDEFQMRPDKCLHIRATWASERSQTRMWDKAYPDGTCVPNYAHCGATFIPSVSDQQPYLTQSPEIQSCARTSGSEGIFSAAKSNIPWSIKWSRPLCSTLQLEGFWGGHTGPWFHRQTFGWSFWDTDKANPNSNARLVAKWSGHLAKSRYINPEITSGKFLVNWQEPRFPGFECVGRMWFDDAESATSCYDKVMADEKCGKRFVTFNDGNGGCACYPKEMDFCSTVAVSHRLTWDFEPPLPLFEGYSLPDEKLYDGKRCAEGIVWMKGGAGDANACLEKMITEKDPNCGRKYITWIAGSGGCACYPPDQTTCTGRRESGRQTFEIQSSE